MFYRFKGARKTGEGPLHPQPKGWGIRDPPRSRSKKRIASMPLFVSDGLKFYAKALLKFYSKWITYPRTGKRGRPRLPKLVPDLRYAQVIKYKADGAVRKVKKKVIFGKDIDPKEISTSLILRDRT